MDAPKMPQSPTTSSAAPEPCTTVSKIEQSDTVAVLPDFAQLLALIGSPIANSDQSSLSPKSQTEHLPTKWMDGSDDNLMLPAWTIPPFLLGAGGISSGGLHDPSQALFDQFLDQAAFSLLGSGSKRVADKAQATVEEEVTGHNRVPESLTLLHSSPSSSPLLFTSEALKMQDGYSDANSGDHDAHGAHQQSHSQQLHPHQQYAMSLQGQQFAQQQQQQQASVRYQQNASHNPLQVLYQAAAGSIFYPHDVQQAPLHIGHPAHTAAGQMALAQQQQQFVHPGHNDYHQPQVAHTSATSQAQVYSYDAPGSSTSATHASVPSVHSAYITQATQNTQPAFSQGSYQQPTAFVPTTDSTTVMPTIPHAQTLHHPISAGDQYVPVQAPVAEPYSGHPQAYHPMQGRYWSAQAHQSVYETAQPLPLQHRPSGSSATSRSGASDGIVELESPMTVTPARAGQTTSRSPYSATGFDFLTLLAAVVNRDNSRATRKIQLPEVDLSVSFLAVDCHAPDMPIVYASPTFLALTGYSRQEVIHKNCRFLQSPTGIMQKGDARSHTEAHLVGEISQSVGSWDEIQVHLTNYRKGGQAFENMVTIIPIRDPTASHSDPNAGPRYLIGFQVDVTFGFQADEHMRNSSYIGNFSVHGVPRAPNQHEDNFARSVDLHTILGTTKSDDLRKMVYNILVEHNTDFILALSLEGGFMSSSPVFCRLLGYTMEQLGQRTLLELCNSMDAAPLQNTIKAVSKLPEGSPPARLLFRIRIGPALNPPPSADQFAWVECTAQKHPEQTKSKQSILISGRRVTLPPMPSGPVAGIQAWAFLDNRGTVLYSGPSSRMMTEDEFLLVDTSSFRRNTEQPSMSAFMQAAPPNSATMSAGPSQPGSSHDSSRSGSSTRGAVIAPAIGRPFWEIAADRKGQEDLYNRILHAPPNGMPDCNITLEATQEPAVVSLSMTNGRYLAIVRDPNATPDTSGQQLGAGELDVRIPKAWKAQLAELQSETLELRRQLEERKRAPTLGKRQRD